MIYDNLSVKKCYFPWLHSCWLNQLFGGTLTTHMVNFRPFRPIRPLNHWGKSSMIFGQDGSILRMWTPLTSFYFDFGKIPALTTWGQARKDCGDKFSEQKLSLRTWKIKRLSPNSQKMLSQHGKRSREDIQIQCHPMSCNAWPNCAMLLNHIR